MDKRKTLKRSRKANNSHFPFLMKACHVTPKEFMSESEYENDSSMSSSNINSYMTHSHIYKRKISESIYDLEDKIESL